MSMMQCTYRDHLITAEVMEYPGTPTPWAGGCRITDSAGHAFMAELEKAQRVSIAHGKWLVDQHLDHGRQLFQQAA